MHWAAKPLLGIIWINDDDDLYKENGTSPNLLSTPDCRQTTASALDVAKDFFPVFLDIKSLVSALPPDSGAIYTLKQEDGALSFIYTNLTRDSAFLYKSGLNSVPYQGATITPITVTGAQLSENFLNRIKDGDEGVLLMEGTAATTKPLVLVVEKGGVKITEVSLDLSIGQDIVLLVHGMNSNVITWDKFVSEVFGTSASASDSIIGGFFSKGLAPDRNAGGVRCYRFQAGANETVGTARMGLEHLTTANAVGQDPNGNLTAYLQHPLVKCGDFETFDELGQELDDAIAVLQTRHPNAHIILVGHSRGGLVARAFLQNPNFASEQSAVVGCLITSSPQRGSPMGRVYNWLSYHFRHKYDDQENTPLLVPVYPNDNNIVVGRAVAKDMNTQDWKTVDFLMQTEVNLGVTTRAKPFLDIRRPVIMDMADNSTAIQNLNTLSQVANLPRSVTYGEIVYQMSEFGLLGTGRAPNDINVTSTTLGSYSVFRLFDGGQTADLFLSCLSAPAKDFLTSNRSPDDPALVGDGLIPAALQHYTNLTGFSARAPKLGPLTNNWYLSVHVDAPSRVDDLLPQLRQIGSHWFP
jgi:pimeloyl-ACP methyl ester carboxylesterase